MENASEGPMWPSGQDLAFSPPWPGIDSRLCPFYCIIKQIKKSRFPMLQYEIIFYDFRVQNFVPSADCITSTIIVIQFCYRHQPFGLQSHVVQWLGSGALTAVARVRFPVWEIYRYLVRFPSSSKNKRNGFTQFISRQSLSNLMLRIQSRLALEVF